MVDYIEDPGLHLIFDTSKKQLRASTKLGVFFCSMSLERMEEIAHQVLAVVERNRNDSIKANPPTEEMGEEECMKLLEDFFKKMS